MRAIVAGQTDPEILAGFRDPACKNSSAVIRQSLEGNFRSEHLFALKQSLQLYDYHTEMIEECDREIERRYREFNAKADTPTKPMPTFRKKQKKRKNQPTFDLRAELYKVAGVDLTAIDGCNAVTIQTVLSETGIDMRPWPTCGHFTSWLRLCPHNDVSGGRVLKSRTQKTANRANAALRLAAQSLSHSNSWLGAYYRRQRARLGPPKAVTAAAHKIARIIYHMLKYGTEFVDLGTDHYEAQYRRRQIRGLEKKARTLGLHVVPVT